MIHVGSKYVLILYPWSQHQDCIISSASENGLFKPVKDSTRGCWLNQDRTLEYYDLNSGDMLQYKKKIRPLRVRTLDDSVKTLLVDDSQTVAELIKAVCARIGRFPSL